jgi:hypothetical protein
MGLEPVHLTVSPAVTPFSDWPVKPGPEGFSRVHDAFRIDGIPDDCHEDAKQGRRLAAAQLCFAMDQAMSFSPFM